MRRKRASSRCVSPTPTCRNMRSRHTSVWRPVGCMGVWSSPFESSVVGPSGTMSSRPAARPNVVPSWLLEAGETL